MDPFFKGLSIGAGIGAVLMAVVWYGVHIAREFLAGEEAARRRMHEK